MAIVSEIGIESGFESYRRFQLSKRRGSGVARAVAARRRRLVSFAIVTTRTSDVQREKKD